MSGAIWSSDHRNRKESRPGSHGQADVDLLPGADLTVDDAGVHVGVLFERRDQRPDDEWQVRELYAAACRLGLRLAAQRDDLRHVDFFDVRVVRHRGLGDHHALGNRAAQAAAAIDDGRAAGF